MNRPTSFNNKTALVQYARLIKVHYVRDSTYFLTAIVQLVLQIYNGVNLAIGNIRH